MERPAPRNWWEERNADKCLVQLIPLIGTKAVGGTWWILEMNKLTCVTPLTILTIGLWLNDRYKKWTDFGLIYLDFGHWTTSFGTKKPDMNDTDCFIDFNDFNWQINKQTQFWLERQLFLSGSQTTTRQTITLQLTLKKDFVDLRDQKTPETRHRHF